VRLLEFGSVTIVGLYVLNMPKVQLPQRTVLKWLSGLFVVTVAGGLLGLVAPHLSFTGPLELLLPHSVRSNTYTAALIHPVAAQVQDVFGTGVGSPRPAAPWGYTNFWGNEISLLVVWTVVYVRLGVAQRTRRLLIGAVVVSVVPIVYSLNRGLWLGLGLTALYLLWRSAATGDLRKPLAVLGLLPIAGLVFIATPLHTTVEQRASHGQSNDIRSFLDKAAYNGALHSPILGWGDTRKAIGSASSIAIGPSASCPNCGGAGIGSTGELWQVLFSQGFLGLAFYLGFFGLSFWALRRERRPVAVATRLILLLAVFYTVFYNNLPVALTLVMISIGLAGRERDVAPPQPVQARPRRAGSGLARAGT
jgi:hypothetical protein